MATRKIFIEESGKQIIPFIENGLLILEIRNVEGDEATFLKLKADSKEFAREIYRLSKHIL